MTGEGQMKMRNWRLGLICGLVALLGAPAHAQKPGGARADAPQTVPELPASDLLLRYQAPELHFRWSLAAEAALEPALVQSLRQDALVERESRIRAAKEAQEGREYPQQHDLVEKWRAEAETDLLLTLSAEEYSYTGGAHGNLVLKAVIWDRGAGQRVRFVDLFSDAVAMQAALQPQFCAELNAERKRRRDGALGPMFNECPDATAYPIVPMGDSEIHAIRVLVPPYEAGPWVEGAYEITLDTSALRPYLLPRYAPAFVRP